MQMNWLPDMDLNHDKQIQSLLCYRYTIGQAGAQAKLKSFLSQSSYQTAVPEGRMRIAYGFNRGFLSTEGHKPRRRGGSVVRNFSRPCGTRSRDLVNPRLKPWAIVSRPVVALRLTLHDSRASSCPPNTASFSNTPTSRLTRPTSNIICATAATRPSKKRSRFSPRRFPKGRRNPGRNKSARK